MWGNFRYPGGGRRYNGGAAARDRREVFVYLSGRRIQKFSSTFFKRWRVLRAEPLAAIRRWRNALYFRRIWGFGGLCKRKAPKAPLFCTFARRLSASPMGRWPRRGRRGHSLSFHCLRPPCGFPFKFLPLRISRLPPGGVVGSRPDSRVTFLCGQESNQRSPLRGPPPAP